VVTGEDNALGGKAVIGGNLFHEGAEVFWGHPGIAAILVDLVARGFDQQREARG
jgi:hypothetical protein